MSKFFCSTKDKNVDVQINYIKATTQEDKSDKMIPGIKVCMENKYGYCFEYDRCPLRNK